VSGLNNFQVGFPAARPMRGSAVDPSSYDVCGSVNVPENFAGLVIDVQCTGSTGLHRYVVVQSLDASAEKLCIAEACVNVASQSTVASYCHNSRYFSNSVSFNFRQIKEVKRELLDTVKARKLAYYGHIMRKPGSCLEKEIMQGTVSGARRRGRPHTAWMDNIKTWTGLSVQSIIIDRGQR